ncbi:MAG: biotin--[acetyl-CoA-carboxylase] ligase [Bacteroidota bacterium]
MALGDSDNSLLIGSQHIRLNRVNSTNKYALEMSSKSKPIEGTVISASYQYDGRGQIGRFWDSEEGKNITCSTILHPTFLRAHDQFQLNMAVSLAIIDFVEHFLDAEKDIVKIKWPNDIYVNDAKIAGILIQNAVKGKYINSSVIGTGININQIEFAEKIPNPTSLASITGEEVDIETAFPWLFRFMTKRYLQLSKGMIDSIRSEYLDHLYRNGIWSNFSDDSGQNFEGKIKTIDQHGQLVIELKDGKDQSFAFREIKFII